jgi:hypothetical protein
MNGETDQSVRRIMPQSGLDFNMMLTDTMYGSQQIGAQLKRKMKTREQEEDPEKAEAWELLSFYTRDLRLSNIGEREFVYCQYYIDLAGDCLREGYMEAFAKSLALAATVLELAQSKGGFLRKRQNTLTQENVSGELEAPKKRLLFAGKKRDG